MKWQIGRFLGFGSVLALVLAVGTDEVLAKKKDAKKATAKDIQYRATPDEYKKIQNVKELAGSLVSIDGAAKVCTIRVEIQHMEPNPNYKPPQPGKGLAGNTNPQSNPQYQLMKAYQDIQRQQQLAMTAKTPQQRQQAMQRIQADMMKLQQQMAKANMQTTKTGTKTNPNGNTNPNNQPFRSVSTYKDYELELQDEVVVRKTFLGLEYDDTGNPKQYTEKEKEELRGKDKTKPGYVAKFDEIQPSQEVRLYLTPPKVQKKVKEKPKEKDAAKDADAIDDGVGNIERPTVNMIILTKDAAAGGLQGADTKKKGKK